MNITQKSIDKALKDVSNGMPIYLAAKKHGMSRSTLQNKAKLKKTFSPSQKKAECFDEKKMSARKLRKDGMSLSKISKELNCHESSVRSWCKDIVLTKEQHRSNSVAKDKDRNLAVQYRKKGMFIPEIARTLNCSKGTVCDWLKDARKNDKELDLLAVKRKEENSYKTEALRFLDEVVDLRLSGYGCPEIAQKINKRVEFVTYTLSQHTFSEEQEKEIKTLVKKRTLERRHSGELKPVGGVRQGVERSKFGYYQGIYCSSTYELCWVIYNLDHGKAVKRFDGFLQCPKKKFKYYPDFIEENNHIIEIKGYEDKFVPRKTKLAESLGYKVTLLKEEDLQDIFSYVDEKYNVKRDRRHTLYDNHKPVHVFNCAQCQKDFEVFNLRKRHKDGLPVFCTMRCSALYRHSQIGGSSNRKIAFQDYPKIKKDRDDGFSLRALAKKYNVSLFTIQSIIKHLEK